MLSKFFRSYSIHILELLFYFTTVRMQDRQESDTSTQETVKRRFSISKLLKKSRSSNEKVFSPSESAKRSNSLAKSHNSFDYLAESLSSQFEVLLEEPGMKEENISSSIFSKNLSLFDNLEKTSIFNVDNKREMNILKEKCDSLLVEKTYSLNSLKPRSKAHHLGSLKHNMSFEDDLFSETIKCRPNLVILNLSGTNLENIQLNVQKQQNISNLNISNSLLKSIPLEVFELADLEVLDCSNNEITEIPSEIKKLAKLKILYLSNNQITSIPNEISELVHLKILYIENNKLSKLNKGILLLPQLRSIDLSDNQFDKVPLEICFLNSLVVLKMRQNKISSLSYTEDEVKAFCESLDTSCYIKRFQTFVSLYFGFPGLHSSPGNENVQSRLKVLQKILKIFNERRKSFVPGLHNLKSLQFLDLGKNIITSLPDDIAYLTSLLRLDLSNNQLKEVTEPLCHLTSLMSLNLSKNRIEKISYMIGQLVNLEVLEMSHNNIPFIPFQLENLKKLEVLIVSNNCLSLVPKYIEKFSNLSVLDFSYNSVLAFNVDLSVLPHLEVANFKNNQIFFISDVISKLKDNKSLRILNFEINNIPHKKKRNGLKTYISNKFKTSRIVQGLFLNDLRKLNLKFLLIDSFGMFDDTLSQEQDE